MKMSPPSFQHDQHYPHPHPNPYHRGPHPVKQETTLPPAVTTTTNNNNVYGRMTPPPSSLKVNRDSHMIKKSLGPSSAKLNQQQQQQQQRGPVIIYTHSPKVIHTNPRDFMALVQKLTGMSRNEEAGTSSKESESTVPNHESDAANVDYTLQHQHQDNNNYMGKVEGSTCLGVNNNNNHNNNNNSSNSTDDNESSSVITDENCSSSGNNTGDVGQFNPYMTTPQLFDLLPAPPPNLPLYLPSSSDMLCYGGDSAIYDYYINFPYDQIT
ncbi:VQ motif-containing protein 20-like [Chenopodium quinoa]|uniref:VQ motif-containing protein 20-like n=1 Tax=Chenopodium quinoa TaxID=63459 RepID=UPI000B77F508|nr:VQ motif-containing protein 20-like [Chenopodium quinoa]